MNLTRLALSNAVAVVVAVLPRHGRGYRRWHESSVVFALFLLPSLLALWARSVDERS